MQRRTTIIATTALTVAAAGTGLGLWLAQPSYDDMVKDCQKAITAASTDSDRPAACEGLKQDDYEDLRMAWVLDRALAGMPKKQRDTLDYYDDGSINGSIGGDE